MKPYYQDKWVRIYHGDCRVILPRLDIKVDLVLTDPPYGIGYHSGYYKYGNPHKRLVGDSGYPTDLVATLCQIADKAVFMFCRWDYLWHVPQPKSFIAMVKNNWTAGDLEGEFGRMWEGILFYPQNGHKFNKRIPDVIDCRRVPPTELLHPTQKPDFVCQTLIEACSNPTNLILDPFLGSGTTCFCAKKLNRYSIGIEIEEKYCEIAARRCSQEVMELV